MTVAAHLARLVRSISYGQVMVSFVDIGAPAWKAAIKAARRA